MTEILPLPKITSPEDHKDYRPISLLWHNGKLLEHFIVKQLRTIQLQENQYAYMPGKGCTDALVNFVNDAVLKLDRKETNGIHALLIDYSKAFDNMDHATLIAKMEALGVGKDIINTTNSFLSDRVASVVIRQTNTRITTKPVDVGVPQGSLLGPVLWNIFVNDMPSSNANVIKYADDTTAYTELNGTNSNLQIAANDISRWSTKNHLTLNTNKTKSMVISLKNRPDAPNITIANENIDEATTFKLLGVTVDCNLNFNNHVDNITSSGRSKCHGLTKLKRYGVNKQSLLHAYRSNILPTVQYAAPAWFNFTSNKCRKDLEGVQRLALKIIYPELDSYNERLQAASIETIVDDLEIKCAMYCQKKKHLHQNIIPAPEPVRNTLRKNCNNVKIPNC